MLGIEIILLLVLRQLFIKRVSIPLCMNGVSIRVFKIFITIIYWTYTAFELQTTIHIGADY